MTPKAKGPELSDLFHRIAQGHTWLMEALKTVLEETGSGDVIRALPTGEDRTRRLNARHIRAFSLYFQLLNMAEENASNQIRRHMEDADVAEKGLLEGRARQSEDRGWLRHMRDIELEPVLTAHPTEARRDVVLAHTRELYQLLVERENSMYSDRELKMLQERVVEVLEKLWLTADVAMDRPRVASELEQILYYLSQAFPRTLQWMDERLLDVMDRLEINRDLPDWERLPRLKFGSWVGGDRDGHADVTAEVTQEAFRRMNAAAVKGFWEHLQKIQGSLSLSSRLISYPKGRMEKLLSELSALGYEPASAGLFDEPLVLECEKILRRLPGSGAAGAYRNPAQLKSDLVDLAEVMVQAGHKRLVRHSLLPLIRRAEVFGFHGASLDIRQNSQTHEKALASILKSANLIEDWWALSEAEQDDFLNREIRQPRPFLPLNWAVEPEARLVLEPLKVFLDHHRVWQGDGQGSMIISMTQKSRDLKIAALLQREAGLLGSHKGGWIPLLPIVPLFETVEDLKRAPQVLEEWLGEAVAGRLLDFEAQQKNWSRPRMQIMIGYSDSAKDGGILASQWNLWQSQSLIHEILQKAGIQARFFHGRGGTVSRGAGPTDRFLEALPAGTLGGDLRMTEQGETIAQKYANPMNATFHLELQAVGALWVTHGNPAREPHGMKEAAARLAEVSRGQYRRLLESEGFVSFYAQATPLDVLENARIGSRASRRSGVRSLEDLRAIPWVFSWNQARFYLPGWYGVGSALKTLGGELGWEELQKLVQNSPFLRYGLMNIDTSFASASLPIMYDYANLVKPESLRAGFMQRIEEEYRLTQDGLNRILGGDFSRRRPRLSHTLKLREDALKRLHHEQVQLLEEWRQETDPKKAQPMLERLLLLVNAIAAGERSTG